MKNKPKRSRSAKRQRKEPPVTTRLLSDDEFDALQKKKSTDQAARLDRRRKALEVLGTTPKAERAAAREVKNQPLSEFVAEQIDAGETVSKKSSEYRRKIRRK